MQCFSQWLRIINFFMATLVGCLWWYNLGTVISKWSCRLSWYIHYLPWMCPDPCECLGLLLQLSLIRHIFYCLILMVGQVQREWLRLLHLAEYGQRGEIPLRVSGSGGVIGMITRIRWHVIVVKKSIHRTITRIRWHVVVVVKKSIRRDGLGILYGAPRGILRIVFGEKSRKHADHSGNVEGIMGDAVL